MQKSFKILGIVVLSVVAGIFIWQKYHQPQVDKCLLEEAQWFAYFEWITPAIDGKAETIDVCYLSDRVAQCYRIIGCQIYAYHMTSNFNGCVNPINSVRSGVFDAVRNILDNQIEGMEMVRPSERSFQRVRFYVNEKHSLLHNRIVEERTWHNDDIHPSLVRLHQTVCEFLMTLDYWKPSSAFIRLLPRPDDTATVQSSQAPETGGAGLPEWYHFRQRDILKVTTSPFLLFPLSHGVNPFQHMGLKPSFGDKFVVKSQTLDWPFVRMLFTAEFYSGETETDAKDYQQGVFFKTRRF